MTLTCRCGAIFAAKPGQTSGRCPACNAAERDRRKKRRSAGGEMGEAGRREEIHRARVASNRHLFGY
jgi:hypothetical protein